MARLAIPGTNRAWLLEARRRTGTYDGELPGDAVIVHELSPDRREPLWGYDAGVPPGDISDGPGVQWLVGETFEDAENDIAMTVDSTTTDGFVVTVRYRVNLIFADDFESGSTASWCFCPVAADP
jgi:hypothetical protein